MKGLSQHVSELLLILFAYMLMSCSLCDSLHHLIDSLTVLFALIIPGESSFVFMKDILLTLAQFAMKMDKESQLKNVSSFIVVMLLNKTRPAGERPPPRLSIKKRPVDPGRENPRKPASGLGLAAPWPWAGP